MITITLNAKIASLWNFITIGRYLYTLYLNTSITP
jgi:hypothetical protein